MVDFSTSVSATGPVFDGRAKTALNAYFDEAKQEVAQVGVNDVHAELGQVLKHPTGHYQSRITTTRAKDNVAITDGGVIYGPWLEGTSSRNQSTRFKGYSTFRRMTQKLQQKAVSIAEPVLGKYLGRMN